MTFDELHRQPRNLVGRVTDVVEGDDVRVRQPAGGARLGGEPVEKRLVVGALGGHIEPERLHRDGALDQRVERLVHGAHGPVADRFDDLVAIDLPRDLALRFAQAGSPTIRISTRADVNFDSARWIARCV